jgi:EAL domain-containing protein (putative c-di-GMP-specific phosphodiesterase class I)
VKNRIVSRSGSPATWADSSAANARRILIVEDDDDVATFLHRALAGMGYVIHGVPNGAEAIGLFKMAAFDAVVSDLAMPGMSGIQLLKALREHDADASVVILTGKPEVESAITAVEYGAVRYLLKPVRIQELREAVGKAVQAKAAATMYRRAVAIVTANEGGRSRDLRESDFKKALDGLYVAYQPIVQAKLRTVVGYEALVRTEEETLRRATDLLAAAELFGAIPELGRRVRRAAADGIASLPSEALLFVNLHALEMDDERLYSDANPLKKEAHRVVFELTGQSRLNRVERPDARIGALRMLGFLLSVDDLGSGYSALSTLVRFSPDYAKIDTSIVKGVDKNPAQKTLIACLVRLCNELQVRLVCEGVETVAEGRMLAALGAELLQGYYFARPSLSVESSQRDSLLERVDRLSLLPQESAPRLTGA